MDLSSMSLPVILALIIGKALKSHPKIDNAMIPWLLFLQQFLQELAKQLQAQSGLHPNMALAAAVPIVATAVLTHSASKGFMAFMRKALPAVFAIAKAMVKVA